MGRLIREEDISDNTWYFTDDCFEWNKYGSGRYLVWPNSCFPHFAAIDFRELEDNKVKIEIRKWIESSINDTVITRTVNKSYRVYYGNNEGSNEDLPYDMWDKSYDVKMLWLVFYFENSESLLAFKLRFVDIISEIIERDPEDLDKITENRRH